MCPTDVDVQSWGSWAIQFEESSGMRIHGDMVDEALDAWRQGVSVTDFVAQFMARHPETDRRAAPFADPDDPSSPLLASGFVALMLLAVGLLLGWAIAPSLMELFR
jgi:hypothetical protein